MLSTQLAQGLEDPSIARQLLQRKKKREGVKDLPSAMDAADSLVDYKLGKSSESDTSKPRQEQEEGRKEQQERERWWQSQV